MPDSHIISVELLEVLSIDRFSKVGIIQSNGRTTRTQKLTIVYNEAAGKTRVSLEIVITKDG